jgi:hypothetical protein
MIKIRNVFLITQRLRKEIHEIRKRRNSDQRANRKLQEKHKIYKKSSLRTLEQ